jgi:hypothetical protein
LLPKAVRPRRLLPQAIPWLLLAARPFDFVDDMGSTDGSIRAEGGAQRRLAFPPSTLSRWSVYQKLGTRAGGEIVGDAH